MADTRHKNALWTLRESVTGTLSWEQVQTAVLMDIRDELQALNRLLGCQNFVAVPTILRSIRRNTAKPRPKPKRRKRAR